MKNSSKKIIEAMLVIAVFMVLIGITVRVSAAVVEYTPLAPLPGASTADEVSDLPKYLTTLFKLALGGASALAVIMITLGGIEYMSTDSMFGKEAGKERIKQALLGLMLAISAWLILYTVNPRTLEFKFNPTPIPKTEVIPSTPEEPGGGFLKYRYCYSSMSDSEPFGISLLETYSYLPKIAGSNRNISKEQAQIRCNNTDPNPTTKHSPASSACPPGIQAESIVCEDHPAPTPTP